MNGLFEDEAFEGFRGTITSGTTGAAGTLTTGAFLLGAIMRIEDQL